MTAGGHAKSIEPSCLGDVHARPQTSSVVGVGNLNVQHMAVRVARELRESGEASSSRPPSGPLPLEQRTPVTPRDVIAKATPVHLDDALAKRVKEAMAKKVTVVQACSAAGPAFECLKEMTDALASSRGALATMRANYQELYDICEGWHEKAIALQSAADDGAGAAAAQREYAATLAACEAFQKKQREQLEAALAAQQKAEHAAKEAVGRERAAMEQAARDKKALLAARDEVNAAWDSAAGKVLAAQKAQAEAEAELRREREAQDALGASGRERWQAAEAKVKELEERLQEHDVANVRRVVEERERAERQRQLQAAHDALASRLESTMAELGVTAEQVTHLQGMLRAAEDRARDEAAKRVAAEAAADARVAAVMPERDSALARAAAVEKERDAALARISELETRLEEAIAQRDELTLKLLAAPASAPAPAPPPPPVAKAAGPSKDELAFRALQNELGGWKLVADQAEMVKEKMERELKAANRTIAQLRERANKDNKENGAAAPVT